MDNTKQRLVTVLVILFLFIGVVGLFFLPFIGNLQSPEFRDEFSSWITSLGIAGIIVFFGIQLLQNMTALIPIGGPLQVIAGAAYGLWGGFLILMASYIVSTLIIFFLVRRFGSSIIIRLFGADVINNLEFMKNEKNTSFVIFILFFIPGLPKDAMTYIAATTKIPLTQFLPLAVIARFPAMFSGALMGDAAMQGNWILFAAIFGFTGLAGILGIQFRSRIMKYLSSRV